MAFEIIIWAVVALIVLAVIGYLVIIYNGLVRLKNDIEKAWSNIDVLLKQRNDEIPNLVNAVKGYMKHEQGIIDNVTKARAAMMAARTPGEAAAADSFLTGALGKLFAIAENYPQLRATENFQQLQNRISGLENEVADRREFYNDAVNNYNIRIESIPDSMVAGMLKYGRKEMFKVMESEKAVPKVEF